LGRTTHYRAFLSNQKSPAVKKCVSCCEKRCEVQGGNQEMAVMHGRLTAKILIITIQVNLCCILQVLLGLGRKFT